MSKRVRQLEDALQIAHASLTSAKHLLLSDDLLAIKSGVDIVSEMELSDSGNVYNEDAECPKLFMLGIGARGSVLHEEIAA